MKILLASKMMEMGGIERSVVAIARELKNRGNQIWVISSGGYCVRDLEQIGVPHVLAPFDATPGSLNRSARTLRSLINGENVDLVHSFSATASAALFLARYLPGSPALKDVHVVSSPMGLQNSPRELATTTWLRNWFLTLGAERILVISPEIRRHLRSVRAREETLVDFNFVGLDVERMDGGPADQQGVRAEFGFPADARIVSTIGALHPRKSHDLFVDAAGQIAQKLPQARFLVVGGGDLQPQLEEQARQRGLDGRIVFTGVRDDVSRLLTATDVYVKPGVVEGFIGITVLEAMAVNKPVVAFDTQDVKLALTDDVTGLVVPNADVGALADRVVYLLEHPEVGQRLGEAGHQLVLERFHFGILAQKLERFYCGLLDVSQARPPIEAW